MKILALELSSAVGSIAWRDGDEGMFATEFANNRQDSGLFFENLQRRLERFGNPQRIVIGLGPGSYAGTRIAIATAIGLQAATSADLSGLPSICAMRTEATTYGVIGDARRQSFFFAQVHNRSLVADPVLFTEPELSEFLLSFALPVFTAEQLPAFPQAVLSHPSAFVLAQVARNVAVVTAAAPLEPIYLREPHVTQARLRSFSAP